jgi:glycerol-3-phosphate acyltransferase PlsY
VIAAPYAPLHALLAVLPTSPQQAVVDVEYGALAVSVGYGIGAINPAAIIARVRGTDLRAVGSGNPGATNAGRAFGWQVGVLVAILDILKGYLPVLAFELLDRPSAALLAGFAAVVGHITSPFLRGRGGKGVATSLGAVLAVQPVWLVPVLLVFGVVLLVTRRVGVSSVAGALMLVPASLWRHSSTAQIVFAVALALLILVRHRRNLLALIGR